MGSFKVLRSAVAVAACAAVGVYAQFTAINDNFDAGVTGWGSNVTADATNGNGGTGCMKMVAPGTDGVGTDHGLWNSKGWPTQEINLSYWGKQAGGEWGSHLNVLFFGPSWQFNWVGMVNLTAPWDANGETITENFPDLKSMSNPWGGDNFETIVNGLLTTNSWTLAGSQGIVVTLNFQVKNAGTLYIDDVVAVYGPVSVKPQQLTVKNAVQKNTGRALTVMPNGRVVGADKLDASSYLVKLVNGQTLQSVNVTR